MCWDPSLGPSGNRVISRGITTMYIFSEDLELILDTSVNIDNASLSFMIYGELLCSASMALFHALIEPRDSL